MEISVSKLLRNKKLSYDSFFIVAQIVVFTFAVELLLSTLLFCFNLYVTWHLFFAAFIISSILCVKINKSVKNIEILFSFLIFIFAIWASSQIFDFSWDGNAYHKLAVGLLKNRWNPIKQIPSLSLTEGPGIEGLTQSAKWVETYCKATWIYGASIYAITSNIETGKSYTIVMMICAFLYTFYYLSKKKYCISNKIIFSLLICLNPIAIQQMFTFYIDGFLHTTLIIVIISLLMLEEQDIFNKKATICMLIASIVICGNIKFTGLLYSGIYCIVFYIYDSYKMYFDENHNIKKIFRLGVLYLLILIVTVVWAGATSYMTNLIRHGSLTYPLTGKNKVDIMTGNSPFYTDENHFKNLFISLFSQMDNFQGLSEKKAIYKIPFTVHKNELSFTMLPDARISGFGVLFGGLVIIAIITIISYYVISHEKKCTNLTVIIIASVFLTFAIKESWWARYSPYIYILVLCAEFILIRGNNRILKCLATVLAIVILINNSIPLMWVRNNVEETKKVHESFVQIKNNHKVIEVCNPNFEGLYYQFKDYNIYYYVNNNLVNEQDVNVMDYRWTLWKDKELY